MSAASPFRGGGRDQGASRTTGQTRPRNLDRDRFIDGDLNASLLEALTGRNANRDRAVANRTRRVVMGSAGVIQEHKQDKSRARAVALAVTLVLLLLIAPLLWEATDSLIAGEHLGDAGNQWSLWACIVCPTLLGAALVAGWWRKRF